MFKKSLLWSICISVCLSGFACAATIKAEALSPFSTEEPTKTFTFRVVETIEYDDDVTLPKGTTVTAEVQDVVSPKRLKRNATFTVIPKTYTDAMGHVRHFPTDYVCKYALPLDKKDIAIKTGATVGGFFVKGLSLGVSAVRGAIDNEENNRFKSAAVRVYDDSPVSMVENGQEINLVEGDRFYLKYRSNDDDDDDANEPNYTYTELDK